MSDPRHIDPARCPLCGIDNSCGAEKGAGTCWCFSIKIPPEVLNRVPAAQRDRACICERCASGRRSAVESATIIQALTRDR